jgi:hypothetical protein
MQEVPSPDGRQLFLKINLAPDSQFLAKLRTPHSGTLFSPFQDITAHIGEI